MSKDFDFVVFKEEIIELNRLLHSLALLTDLEEVHKANFIWSNIFNRNMFGYTLESYEKFYSHLCRERELNKLHRI